MYPVLKWPGGKEKELSVIKENLPEYSGRYIEPFVGGGAVFFAVDNPDCFINDRSSDLINLYNCISKGDADFIRYIQYEYDKFRELDALIDENTDDIIMLYNAGLSVNDFINKFRQELFSVTEEYNDIFIEKLRKNLESKIRRSKKLESEKGRLSEYDILNNMEAAVKSAYYMYIRYLYNTSHRLSPGRQAAVFFFIREYCYSSMFRYNKNGEFNVPYGGISYNRKDLQKKIDYILSDEMRRKLSGASIKNMDFEDFIEELSLTQNDFMFLDPPYDSDFSTYDKNKFSKEDQIRLYECLKRTSAKIMLVIKNTDFIYNLYKDDFNILNFDKKYLVSFMNRNERDTEHLMITNY